MEIIPRVPCGLGSGCYQGRRVGRIVAEREMLKSYQGYLVDWA